MGTILRPLSRGPCLLAAVFLTAIFALATPGTALTEWPAFRGDSTGSAPSTATSNGMGHLRIEWTTPIPGTGHSTPVSSEGILYVTTARESTGTSWLLVDGGFWLCAAAASGMMLSLLFGLGTVPSLVLFGVAASFIGSKLRGLFYKAAGATVIIMGILFLLRGLRHHV